jgi:hypothetical protein
VRAVTAVIAIGCTLVGCASGHKSTATDVPPPRSVALDGGSWSELVCRRDDADCFDQAARICPLGYLVGDANGATTGIITAEAHGTVRPDDGRLLVRCISSVISENPK